ncbi:MAG: hypothetical protein Q4G64_05445 [bacterium]|nr:hypothetical protein [bacterium]
MELGIEGNVRRCRWKLQESVDELLAATPAHWRDDAAEHFEAARGRALVEGSDALDATVWALVAAADFEREVQMARASGAMTGAVW